MKYMIGLALMFVSVGIAWACAVMVSEVCSPATDTWFYGTSDCGDMHYVQYEGTIDTCSDGAMEGFEYCGEEVASECVHTDSAWRDYCESGTAQVTNSYSIRNAEGDTCIIARGAIR